MKTSVFKWGVCLEFLLLVLGGTLWAQDIAGIGEEPELFSGEKIWTSDKWEFQVTLPTEWTLKITEEQQGNKIAYIENKNGDIFGYISQEENKDDCTAYINNLIESIKKLFGVDIIKKPLGKIEAIVVYTVIDKKIKYQYYWRVIDVSGTKLRFVICTTADKYAKYKDAFVKYAGTLKSTGIASSKKAADKTWTSEKWGFKVTLPSEWTMKILDEIDGTTVAEFYDKANGIGGLIASVDFEGGCDEYLKWFADSLKKNWDVEIVVKPKGESAATLVYICDIDGTDCEYYAHAIDVDGTKLRIVLYCEKKDYDKYEELFARYSETLVGIAAKIKNVKVKDKKWASEKWGFEITLPSNWKMDILDEASGTTIASLSDESNGLYGLIMKEASDSRADDYLKDTIDSVKYEVDIIREPKGKSEATAIFTADIKGTKYQYYVRVIDADGQKIWVGFYCKADIYDKQEETFEKYANTLEAK